MYFPAVSGARVYGELKQVFQVKLAFVLGEKLKA